MSEELSYLESYSIVYKGVLSNSIVVYREVLLEIYIDYMQVKYVKISHHYAKYHYYIIFSN